MAKKNISRRRFLTAAAATAAAGPFIKLGNYRVFAASNELYSDRGYKTSYSFRDKIDIESLDHPKKMYDVTEALIRRGYSDDNIRAVLGENFRRALGEIWAS